MNPNFKNWGCFLQDLANEMNSIDQLRYRVATITR
jgi:hypothetical protein